MDPVIEEIQRLRPGEAVRSDVARRWQQHLRDVVQPQLDELATLKASLDKPKAKKESA